MTKPVAYSSRRKNERDLKLDYFSHVFADFCRLDRADRDAVRGDLPQNLAGLLQQLDQSGELAPDDEPRLDWGEIATIEDKILGRQDEDTLRRRAWQIRARYGRLVGSERYQLYLASGPPDDKDEKTTPASLRADLRRLLAATHLNYSLAMVRENNRRRIMKKVGRWTLGLCALALLAASRLTQFQDWMLVGVIAIVLFCGCLGAYISVQRRLQESTDAGDPIISILGLHEFNSIQPFPVVAGGIFAVVLYFLMAGGFMMGDLFPDLSDGVPDNIAQWGKLFIWSVIAGFAERLVPDTLDRLVNQARPNATPAPVTVNPASQRRETRDEPKRDGAVLAGGGSPQITDIQPREAAPQSIVSIRGAGFGGERGGGSVKFNNVESPAITRWSDAEIQATLPNDALGFVEVVVTLGSGVTVAASADKAIAVE
jgi:hypothetical protein